MELKEFIKKALSDIIGGVEEVRVNSVRNIRIEGDKDKSAIEFEVAVTVENDNTTKTGGSITVLSLLQTGGESMKEYKNSSVSKIKFGIYVDRETKAEESFRKNEQQEFFRQNRQDTDYV